MPAMTAFSAMQPVRAMPSEFSYSVDWTDDLASHQRRLDSMQDFRDPTHHQMSPMRDFEVVDKGRSDLVQMARSGQGLNQRRPSPQRGQHHTIDLYDSSWVTGSITGLQPACESALIWTRSPTKAQRKHKRFNNLQSAARRGCGRQAPVPPLSRFEDPLRTGRSHGRHSSSPAALALRGRAQAMAPPIVVHRQRMLATTKRAVFDKGRKRAPDEPTERLTRLHSGGGWEGGTQPAGPEGERVTRVHL